MSAPSKTSRLGRGSYQRPSADVLDALTDPGPTAAPPVTPGVSVIPDTAGHLEGADTTDFSGTQGVAVTTDHSGHLGYSGTSVTPDGADTGVVSGTLGVSVTQDTAATSDTAGVQDTEVVSGTSVRVGGENTAGVSSVTGPQDDTQRRASVTQDDQGILTRPVDGDAVGASGVVGVEDNSGTSAADIHAVDRSGNSDVQDNVVVSGTRGARAKRANSKPRSTVHPDVSGDSGTRGVPDNRGTSDLPGAKPAATPRDHVKVARPLVDEMRDAVWFLSEHGRPRVQLGELLDEAISAWLKTVKAEHTRGAAFPVRGRLR